MQANESCLLLGWRPLHWPFFPLTLKFNSRPKANDSPLTSNMMWVLFEFKPVTTISVVDSSFPSFPNICENPRLGHFDLILEVTSREPRPCYLDKSTRTFAEFAWVIVDKSNPLFYSAAFQFHDTFQDSAKSCVGHLMHT